MAAAVGVGGRTRTAAIGHERVLSRAALRCAERCLHARSQPASQPPHTRASSIPRTAFPFHLVYALAIARHGNRIDRLNVSNIQ